MSQFYFLFFQLRAGKTPSLKSISVNTGGVRSQCTPTSPTADNQNTSTLNTANCGMKRSSDSSHESGLVKKHMPTLQSASMSGLDVSNDDIDIEGMGEGVLLQDSDMSDINVTDPVSDSEDGPSGSSQGVLDTTYMIDSHELMGLSGHNDPSIIGLTSSSKDHEGFQFISLSSQDPQEDHILVDS